MRKLALMISSPGSNHGKTSLTAGLARYFVRQNQTVQIFKIGPDYLDPMILEKASNRPVYQLDLWMQGEECKHIFHSNSLDADVILVEGSMGLFDGTPCCADLAKLFKLPVVLVVNATGMAESLAAVAQGFYQYDPTVNIKGVIANKTASEKHQMMIKRGFRDSIRLIGCIPIHKLADFPCRHLGLVQASEISDVNKQIDCWSELVAATNLPQCLEWIDIVKTNSNHIGSGLKGVHIAVSKDEAFSFAYAHNLKLLESMGAQLSYFSPIRDTLPECDAIYLTGGYPELYLQPLSKNTVLQQQLIGHTKQNKPLIAECGGLLFLLESLEDTPLCGIIPMKAKMKKSLENLGYQSYFLNQQEIRGHSFHYSFIPEFKNNNISIPKETTGRPEFVYKHGNLIASYIHWQFCSNPSVVTSWFRP